jgi:hypothetical protein
MRRTPQESALFSQLGQLFLQSDDGSHASSFNLDEIKGFADLGKG